MAMTSSSFVVGTPFQAHTASPKRRSQTRTQALFKKKAKPEPVVEEKPQKSGLFGFGKKTKKGQPRSKREEELLAEAAKYALCVVTTLRYRSRLSSTIVQAFSCRDESHVHNAIPATILHSMHMHMIRWHAVLARSQVSCLA